MTTITKERLLTIRQWRETYGPGSNVVLPAEEAEELARIALTSLEAEPVAVNDDMAYAFHHALSDSSLGSDEIEEIKTGLRAALANVSSPVTLDGWISCSERMPNDAQWCVVNTEYGDYVQCWSEGQGWLGDDISIPECDVINWMPLPEPPQEVNRG
ncbi:DUF551 domain-containing protein [Escherichia coli]|nr:DUF551 domain-containing protein [Escherichia coli]EJT9094529.1 DUF551 domain-containing protein [Escherichia coli]